MSVYAALRDKTIKESQYDKAAVRPHSIKMKISQEKY
jgi:hypothetical protein